MPPPSKRLRSQQLDADGVNSNSVLAVISDSRSPSPSGGGADASYELDALPFAFSSDLDGWFDDALALPPASLLGDIRAEPLCEVPEAGPMPDPVGSPRRELSGRGEEPHSTTERARPKPKSSTQRRKEELVYLRGKASELQARLQELKHDRLRAHRDAGYSGDTDGACYGVWSSPLETTDGPTQIASVDSWEIIAMHQQEARFEAEKERARLQAMLQAQIKIARSLEELLSKPAVWNQLQETHWRKQEAPTRTDAEIFTELLHSVDARYPLLEATLVANHLDQSCQPVNDTRINSASPDGICVESRQVKLLPFEFDLSAEVLWQCLCDGKVGLFDCPSMIIKPAQDILFIKTTVERSPILSPPVDIYRVVRRFVEADSVRFIAEIALASSPSPESQLPPLQVVHQGWGRLRPFQFGDGLQGTMLQGFMTSVLTILEPEDGVGAQTSPQSGESRHREIDMLSELLVSVYREKQLVVHRELETALMDATLDRSTRSQRPTL